MGRTLDLAALNVEFRFLGDTNPNAFQASGDFDIDTFLVRQGGTAIDHSLLASSTFSARAEGYTFTSFSFTADGGAVFNAVPVPEPASWALMLAGAAVLLALRRRRAAP